MPKDKYPKLKLKPTDFKAQKAMYEEATRGANQADGSGISSAEMAFRYNKLIDPTPITDALSIGHNYYTGAAQDPTDWVGLLPLKYVSSGAKGLSKLIKQTNKVAATTRVISKAGDVASEYSNGGIHNMKTNKKPRFRLPKYGDGTKVPMTNDEYNMSLYSPEDQAALNGTTDIYNQKRSRAINTTSTGQYVAAGGALAAGGANMAATYGDGDATNRQKADSFDNTARGVTGAVNPVIGGVIGIGDMIGKPIRNNLEKGDSETGKVKNRQAVKFGAVAGMMFDPGKWIGQISNGGLNDISGNKYVDDIEQNNLDRINAQKAQNQTYYNQGGMHFANGGMNMFPNSEVEKEENSIAPDGEFTQYDGPSHEQGGIPTNLDPGEMVFSDKLKLGKKTFAQLNKVNNTNKEDKLLESTKASSLTRRTAELLKMAKLKNSEALFNEQEALKQDKVNKYAQKMGVDLQAQPMMRNGGMHKYPNGGVNPNDLTLPQKRQMYNDSLTLYKSGFDVNVPNRKAEPDFNNAAKRLSNMNGVYPQSTNKNSAAYANDPRYLAERAVPYPKPTYIPPSNNTVPKKTYPMVNMPMKGLSNPELNFNPQLQQVPANTPPLQTKLSNTNAGYNVKNYYDNGNVVDKRYFSQGTNKEIDSFEIGGTKKSKPIDWQTPDQSYQYGRARFLSNGQLDQTDPMSRVASNVNDINSQNTPYVPVNPYKTGYSPEDQALIDGNQPSNNINWGGVAEQAGSFLANNAGNIYNLSRYNKPEVEKYDRAQASYLDPTSALSDATEQTRRAEYNVRGASGGNAGTYLSNRVALNTQNILNKDRIRQQYANQNAGIANQFNMYNNDLSRQEVIANAQNRARNRSGKGETIGSMGSNVANQMKDNKMSNMDQNTLDLMMKYYDTPEFKKLMKDNKFKK